MIDRLNVGGNGENQGGETDGRCPLFGRGTFATSVQYISLSESVIIPFDLRPLLRQTSRGIVKIVYIIKQAAAQKVDTTQAYACFRQIHGET